MTTKKPLSLVLLDSHALIHRAYHALPDFATSSGEPTGALYGLSIMILKILTEFSPDYIVACYDLKGKTHRHEVYEEYKGTRKKIDDNLITQLNSSRDIFKAFNIPMYDCPGFEADDMLGTIVEQVRHSGSNSAPFEDLNIIIASGDMDTLQLIDGKKVQVYTLKKGIKDTIIYDEKGVETRFGFLPALIPDYKGLRGDPSDNIPGIAGIGEKTATTLITTFGTIEEMYKELKKSDNKFKEAGISERIIGLIKDNEEEALFSKMLATIRRDAPITFTLPEKMIRESINVEEAETLFKKLEFRTLGIKLREVLTPADEVSPHPSSEKEEPLSKELEVAVYVLDSNISYPTLDDLLVVTKTDMLEEGMKKAEELIVKNNLEYVYREIELPLIPVVKEMEKRGIKVDVTYLKTLSEKYHKTLDCLEKEIHNAAGEEFNISSPKQLGEILFDKMNLTVKGLKKTAGGARSTKESELLKLRELHPIIDLIMEYRELQKLLGTYIDTIPQLVAEDGRLHAHFLQIGTTTGRMGCENPNLQNIPTKTELGRAIRNAFVAEKGYKLVSVDYSQIDLRIAALLSQDEKFISIFKEGQDVHAAVASEVFGVSPEQVSKEMRSKAKTINFGILYGMGVNALKANIGGTTTEAKEFYQNYFNTFTTLTSYLEKVKEEVRQQGFTTTLFGRRRYFPDIKSHLPFLRASAERMAINAPIQGTQADIIKLSMSRIDEYLKKNKKSEVAHLLLQVHDELIYEIKEEYVDEIATEIKKIMESVFTKEQAKGVPILAHSHVGNNWAEL